MNQYIKYALTVVVTAAAMVAYQYEGKPEQVGLAQQAPSQVPIQVPEIKNDIAYVGQESGQGVLERLNSVESGLVEIWEEKYQEEHEAVMAAHEAEFIANYQAKNVHPFNPIQVVCEEIPGTDDSGESVNTLSCDEKYSLPRHPYFTYETSELETLSYGDALAAQIIADRISKDQPLKALRLLLHAAAISEKSGPLMIAAHRTFSVTNPLREISDNDIYQHVALLEVAKVMGADFGTELEKLPIEIDESVVEELVKEVKASIAQIQITVSGSSNLKELFDV